MAGVSDEIAVVGMAALPPPAPDALEVRQSRVVTAIMAAVFVAIAGAAVLAPYVAFDAEERPGLALAASWWIGSWMAMFAYFYLRHARGARGADGWVLRAEGDRLLINLRSHLNTHFDPQAPAVLVVPRRRIRWMRAADQHGRRAHVDDDGALHQNPIWRQFLEITFDDPATVKSALAEETGRTGPGVLGSRSRYRHSAFRWLDDEGVLRIAWRDEQNRLLPRLEEACDFLRRHFRFAEEVSSAEADIKSLSRAEQEDRLAAMVARGEDMEATKLARLLYGMDLTTAVQFVRELRGKP